MSDARKEARGKRPGPLGSLIALVVFALLISLGVWQLQRLKWKTALLHRIEALQASPPEPLYVALRRLKDGLDVDFVRVQTDCIEPRPTPQRLYLYSLDGGRIAWRHIAACRIGEEGYDFVAVDRGFVAQAGDRQGPPDSVPPPPQRIVGILRRPEKPSMFEPAARPDEGFTAGFRSRQQAIEALERGAGGRAAPVMLVAEQESPAPPGVRASALPANIPNNHLGYAVTWFGLAAALAGVYLALLLRKR